MTFSAAMQMTRSMFAQPILNASTTGARRISPCFALVPESRRLRDALAYEPGSNDDERAEQERDTPAPGVECVCRHVCRNRQKNRCGDEVCPACTPWIVKQAKKPRRPNGACSSDSELDPEISPATAKPWMSRRMM